MVLYQPVYTAYVRSGTCMYMRFKLDLAGWPARGHRTGSGRLGQALNFRFIVFATNLYVCELLHIENKIQKIIMQDKSKSRRDVTLGGLLYTHQ